MSGPARLLLALVHGYQRWLSPLLPPRCRFAPTCSAYAVQALREHGAGRGSWLTVRRMLRCHPFHPGGHDPVPPPRRAQETGAVPGDGPSRRTVGVSQPAVPDRVHVPPVRRPGATRA